MCFFERVTEWKWDVSLGSSTFSWFSSLLNSRPRAQVKSLIERSFCSLPRLCKWGLSSHWGIEKYLVPGPFCENESGTRKKLHLNPRLRARSGWRICEVSLAGLVTYILTQFRTRKAQKSGALFFAVVRKNRGERRKTRETNVFASRREQIGLLENISPNFCLSRMQFSHRINCNRLT